jgi:hypothetical protein
MKISSNHLSQNYRFTIETDNPSDLNQLNALRNNVSEYNKVIRKTNKQRLWLGYGKPESQKRVVIRGRKPLSKGTVTSFFGGTKHNASYDFSGNVYGGIYNATVWDIYVYDR